MSWLSRMARPFRRRSYDGAGGGRRWRGVVGMPSQISSQLAGRRALADRARYLAGNNALAASAVEAWVSALVGSGLKPQSTHPDTGTREALNLSWEAWTDAGDADASTDIYGLQAVMARRLVVDGESFAMLLDTSAGLRVRLLDAEQVDGAMTQDLPGDGRVVQGIEFSADQRRIAYHVRQDRTGMPFGVTTETVRIPAGDIVHLYRPETPGQVRGISWFAPIILRMNDLDQWRDSQLMRQKIAALLAGFIKSIDNQAGFDGEQDALGNLIGGLEPGTLKVLPPGTDVTWSNPAAVGDEVIRFAQMTEREIAVGIGLPAAVLTGDLSDVNYSSIRAGLVEWRRRVEALQHGVLVFQALRPIWQRFVANEVLSGRIATTVDMALGAKWITPRFDWVDPAKDVEAELAAIAGGIMSRRMAVTGRGIDIEALDREIADDARRAKGLGLDFSAKPGPAANTNQPATIAA